MNTFIQVAEIWVPDHDGYLLEFGSGLYANAPDFGGVSRSMCFGRGEGLPGRVWEEGAPVILHDLQSGYFQRAQAAQAARLTCAIAFPVFVGATLKAVVALFCGAGSGDSGGVEVWCHDPRTGSDMRLLDGVYGRDDSAFGVTSRATRLLPGAGLPGLAWQRRQSVVLDGPGAAGDSLQGEAAAASGLRRGLAMPCAVPGDKDYVLAFLSSPTAPIARRVERWVAGVDAQGLRRAAGFDAVDGTLAPEERANSDLDPAISAAFAGAVPQAAPGRAVLALPVIEAETVVDTVAMYF